MKDEEITVFFNDQKLQGFDMNFIEKIEKPEEPKNQVERIVNTFPSRLREQIYDLAKQGCKNCQKHQDRLQRLPICTRAAAGARHNALPAPGRRKTMRVFMGPGLRGVPQNRIQIKNKRTAGAVLKK